MTAESETFYIGGLSERSGASRDTIRYYESTGVLPEADRSGSGYRLYGPDDVDRIAFVGQAQTLGLTLDEIVEILDIVDDGRQPCEHVLERLSARLEETRQRIGRLRDLERRLEETLAREDGRSARAGCRCRIIEDTPVLTKSSGP